MNSKNNLRLLFCFVITFIFATNFPASEVSATCSTSGGSTCVGYDLCIPSYAIASGLKIRAQGDTCYTNCDQACQTAYSVQSSGVELNDDIISLCNLFCKNNIQFYSGKRLSTPKPNSADDNQYFTSQWFDVGTADGKSFGEWYKTTSQIYLTSQFNNISFASDWFYPTTCAINSDQANYNTNLDTRNGGTITITLVNPDPGTANEVILCGHDVRRTEPWYNRFHRNPSASPTPLNSDWSGWPNWLLDYPGLIYTAKSPTISDPVLFIKNGDWLKISYYGKTIANWTPDGNAVPDFIFRKPDNTGNANNTHATICNYTDCKWTSLDPNHYMYFVGTGDYVEGTNYNNYGFTKTSGSGQTTSITYYNTSSQPVTATLPYNEFIANPLQGLSNSFFRMGVMAIDRIINPSDWASGYFGDNWGGMYFKFERKGCVYTNGQRIEYTVTPAGSPPPANAVWQMAPAFSSNKSIITSTKNGKVWLRIAKMATSERSGISCTTGQNETCNQQAGYYSLNDYQNQIYNNVSGQYYMNVEVNN